MVAAAQEQVAENRSLLGTRGLVGVPCSSGCAPGTLVCAALSGLSTLLKRKQYIKLGGGMLKSIEVLKGRYDHISSYFMI